MCKKHEKDLSTSEISRRGFLEGATSYVVMPGVLEVVMQSMANAQCISPSQISLNGLIPVVTFELAGGPATFISDFAGLGPDGLPLNLTAPNKHGIPTGEIATNQTLGSVYTMPTSDFVQGVLSTADPNALPYLTLVTGAAESQDDSSNHRKNISKIVSLAGLMGTNIQGPMGLGGNSDTFGKHRSVIGAPQVVSTKITRTTDFIPASTGVVAIDNLSQGQKASIYRTALKVNASQMQKASKLTWLEQLTSFVQCAIGINLEKVLNPGTGNDATQVSEIVQAFGTAGNIPANLLLDANAANYVLSGKGPVFSRVIGGGDYHNNSARGAATHGGITFDRPAGELFGRWITAAYLLNKPFFVVFNADGAVQSANGADRVWTGDNGRNGGFAFGLFLPPTLGSIQRLKNGIGHFDPSSLSASRQTWVGRDNSNRENEAWALFLNWAIGACRKDVAFVTQALQAAKVNGNKINEITSSQVMSEVMSIQVG